MEKTPTTISAEESEIDITAINYHEISDHIGYSALQTTTSDGETEEAALNIKEIPSSKENSSLTFGAEDDQIDPQENFEKISKLENDDLQNNPKSVKEINKSPTKSSPASTDHKNTSSMVTNRNKTPPTTGTSSGSSPSGTSKIPKREPSRDNKNKTQPNPPLQQPKSQYPRSDSKLSLNKPEFAFGRKVVPASAKSKANAADAPSRELGVKKSFSKFSLKANNKLKEDLKPQTARSQDKNVHSSQRRSASTISARSTPRFKKGEMERNLPKITSTAGDCNEIADLEKKLETVQTEFLQKIENHKSTAETEYKFIVLTKNGEMKLIAKDYELNKLPHKYSTHCVNDFKEKLKNCVEQYFTSFHDNLKDSEIFSNVGNMEMAEENLIQLQISKSNDILSFIDEFCHTDHDGNINSEKLLREELEKCKKTLLESNEGLKKLEKKYTDVVKQHKEELLNLDKKLKSKAEDLEQKDSIIKDLQRKIKLKEKQHENRITKDQAEITDLREKLENSKAVNADLQKNILSLEHQLNNEKNELKVKNETIKNLENDLEQLQILGDSLESQLEEMNSVKVEPNAEPEKFPEHLQEISELQNQLEKFENEKLANERQIEELKVESSVVAELRADLQEAENRAQELQKQLEAKEKSLDNSKELQMELAKLHQSESEKRREIENLKMEMSKFDYNKGQLEEQLQRYHQLLEVRSELINSLQTNEKTQRNQMEELFAQVGERNNSINELNNELHAKSEEFRNLFSTISAKQMELSKQEHIIKLLEESNERSQMLRVKQEEKIARMEEELAHLKQSIAIYQGNILSSNNGKNLLYPSILPDSNVDCNENFYYYTSQRKRKRQVDINVRKYET